MSGVSSKAKKEEPAASKGAEVKPAPASGGDAGAKLRQAALEALQKDKSAATPSTTTDGSSKEESKKEEAKKEEQEAPKLVAEKEEKAAPPQEEKAPVKEEPKKEAAAPAPAPKRSSLAALLAKQDEGGETKPSAIVMKAVGEENISAPPGFGGSSDAPKTAKSNGGKRHVYTKQEMLRLKSLPSCLVRPESLPEQEIVKGPSRNAGGGDNRGGRGGGGRRDSSSFNNNNSNSDWQRGAAAPAGTNRRGSSTGNKDNDSGGQWARGVAPPPPKPNAGRGNQGRGKRRVEMSFSWRSPLRLPFTHIISCFFIHFHQEDAVVAEATAHHSLMVRSHRWSNLTRAGALKRVMNPWWLLKSRLNPF